MTSSADAWLTVNRTLIAKSIGELSFEQILKPTLLREKSFELKLQSNVLYRFEGWITVWDHLRVKPRTLVRIAEGKEETASSAAQFFLDSQQETAMSEINLGNFLEEMQSTLYSDLQLLLKTRSLSAQELATWSGEKVQTVLNGHPKLLLNKGRMGWGQSDLAKFSPETSAGFQLHWLAIRKDLCLTGLRERLSFSDVTMQGLDASTITAFEDRLRSADLDPHQYLLIPAHPWQWDQILQLQFVGEIAKREIFSLGVAGDLYQPQISLRTLTNVSRPQNSDIKLPLTILNTSAIRGIPARYISTAPQVAEAVSQICREDELLNARGTEVLSDLAGVSFQQPDFAKIKGAPYRYHETLGVIWRESVGSKLNRFASTANADGGSSRLGDSVEPVELAVMTGALFHQDTEGRSLIGAYIECSGIGAREWLKRYFDVVVVPLYHLQLKYGLGLVAHGQNVVLKMKNFVPCGVFLKDFQGDLRASKKRAPLADVPFTNTLAAWQDDESSPLAKLDTLPPDYLIHDLLTGHFLTVLRFVSAVLQESDGLPESEFYTILAESLDGYFAKLVKEGRPEPRLNLLAPEIHRVLLNKVRFKIGYADSAERPLPMLGEDLKNPLARTHTPNVTQFFQPSETQHRNSLRAGELL